MKGKEEREKEQREGGRDRERVRERGMRQNLIYFPGGQEMFLVCFCSAFSPSETNSDQNVL